jgi:hypothetical protein
VRTLLDSVRSGGLLLAVYHDLDDEHREHMTSRGVDPADYFGEDDLGRLLGDEFTIERHAVEPRIDPPPGTPTLPTSSCAHGVADALRGARGMRRDRADLPPVVRSQMFRCASVCHRVEHRSK